MPICPLSSDLRTCYADIVAERRAQGPGRGRPSSQDQNPGGDRLNNGGSDLGLTHRAVLGGISACMTGTGW
jgi:hypothetical protein